MKLLKIILFIFAVYFIRRFIQLYKAMKRIQETQKQQQTYQTQAQPPAEQGKVVDADYRVVD